MRAVLEAVQGGDVDTLRRMLQDASGGSSGAHTASDAGGAASTSARTVPAAAERLPALFAQRSTVKLMLPNCDPVRLSTSPQSPPVFPASLPRQSSPPVFPASLPRQSSNVEIRFTRLSQCDPILE